MNKKSNKISKKLLTKQKIECRIIQTNVWKKVDIMGKTKNNILKYVKIFVIVDKNYAYELVGMQYEEM